MKFLSEYEIPYNQEFKGTTIGGLSGIDYDSEKEIYYLISDDRSAINPARFYTAKILVSAKGIDTVQWIATYPMLQSNGMPYPNSKIDPANTPDPEAIRYNSKTKELIWTSEGKRSTLETGRIRGTKRRSNHRARRTGVGSGFIKFVWNGRCNHRA